MYQYFLLTIINKPYSYKRLLIGETGCDVYGNSQCSLQIFYKS